MPKLDARFVSKVQPPSSGRKIYWDDNLKGFGLMMMSSGHRSFVFQYRAAGKLRRMTLHADGVDTARTQAEVLKGKIATGRLLNQPADPLTERKRQDELKSGKGTFKAIAESWYEIDGKNTRSGPNRFREIQRLAFPQIGGKQINIIRRSDIVRLLDTVRRDNGSAMAISLLGMLSRVMSWYEGRDEDFRSPIHREMRKAVGKIPPRQRTLNDNELRIVWYAAMATPGPYGAFIKFTLLTATRREEAAGMRRSELVGNNWIVPAERMKGKHEHVVPLSGAARAIIDSLPRLRNGDLVFTMAGVIPMSGFHDRKRYFDATILDMLRQDNPLAEPFPNWTVHDLRRTARTLMGRARVPADIAELCLDHVKGGERRTYDCWTYLQEKKEAFEALAALIKSIVGLH